jgi:signal transduction histidine kinase
VEAPIRTFELLVELKAMNHDLVCNRKADILIVDDMPDNIRFLSLMLLEHGYNVRKALSGQIALTAAQTVLPDLILLDINMPEMNGYEVCRRLKENSATRDVPVIFLTALSDILDKLKAFQVGAVDYITKPFQFDEVLVRIQTQLTIRNLQTQLQSQNVQLQTALDDLKKAQAQLVQRDKMIALGQLVAGVAHEINNPISFIYGNLNPAQKYSQSLLELIKLYQEECPTPSELIQKTIQEADLDFIAGDLPKLFNSMRHGVDRIQTIIFALRIFSRLNESDIKLVDIHEGIESVLLLLQHRFNLDEKSVIEVVKNYGNLPLVTCYASQLNQVFLDIINNAIDALEEAFDHDTQDSCEQNNLSQPPTPQELPTIWITTGLTSSGSISIRIKDNGIGIAEDLKPRLFEPFFTTKSVKERVGLGLSTSYQIVVEKHEGQLTFQSSPGEGTEFMIEIPAQLTHKP